MSLSILKDFEMGKILGKGAFGRVQLVKRKVDGIIYAMKSIKMVQLSEKEKENSLNEIRILASLSHKNIIGYKDAFYDEGTKTLNIVMEFADDGDISSKIKYNLKNNLHFRENIIWEYLIQILEGLNYLHEKKIIHRDLKSANIFLMKDNTVKIGDLNVSKINKQGMAYTQTGTPYYASPEIWLDQPYDYKSDIWSLGCILYELCELRPPFRGTSLKNLCINIQKGLYNPIPDYYSNELKTIINMMLQKDPNNRPTTGQLLGCDIIVRKRNELKIITKYSGGEEKQGLIATIQLPRNLGEINKSLPLNKYNNKRAKEEAEYEEYENLKNSKFKQQKLPGWRPVPSMARTVTIFICFGIVFVCLGVLILLFSNNIVEFSERYDNNPNCNSTIDDTCEIVINITKKMNKNILVYYQLDGFYQNHRRYVQSRSEAQLRGENISLEKMRES